MTEPRWLTPTVDGNKRVAFQAMYVFLGLNGLRVDIEGHIWLMFMVPAASRPRGGDDRGLPQRIRESDGTGGASWGPAEQERS